MRSGLDPEDRPSKQVSPPAIRLLCERCGSELDSIGQYIGRVRQSIDDNPHPAGEQRAPIRSVTEVLAADLMTVPDAAARIGIHELTVRRWMAVGRIETFRVGPHPFVTLAGVEAVIAERHRRSVERPTLHAGALRVLATLGAAVDGATVRQLSAETALAPVTIRRHLSTLLSQKLVAGGGRPTWTWELTPRGVELLESSGQRGSSGSC